MTQSLHTPNLTSPDMNGYTLDYTMGAWPQQVEFALLEHLFTRLGFPECSCCHECGIIPVFFYSYELMILN